MPQYTQADADALLDKMAAERATLLDTARALSAADADRVPQDAEGEEQWTAKEQLAHLWEMERNYIAWCQAALAENGADVSTVAAEPVAIPIEDAPAHDLAELLDVLIDERANTVAFIETLSLDDFHRTATNQAFGELTIMQWLRSFYRHDRQHAAQLAGRRSDYQPNFASGKEPNQRRMRIDAVNAQRRQ